MNATETGCHVWKRRGVEQLGEHFCCLPQSGSIRRSDIEERVEMESYTCEFTRSSRVGEVLEEKVA